MFKKGPQVGETAPGFTLPDPKGQMVTLTSLLARGPLLLYFYPADFTRVCTKQACMYRDSGSSLAAAGIHIAGISRQDSGSKARFSEAFGLDFTLLADADGSVIQAYGASGLGGLFTRRVAFFVSMDGRILGRVEANFAIDKHQRFLEECIRQVQGTKP